MSAASRGADAERRGLKWLRARGWVCGRNAGSHGAADLWALKRGERPMLLQVKYGRERKRFTPAERAALSADAEAADADAVFMWWVPRASIPQLIFEADWW